MIRSLHFSRTLEGQLNALRYSGKKGEIAVKHFERICSALRSARQETKEIFVKRTKNGEYRLKHCVKYDLGGGYRLITVRVGDRLYLPFLGSHDEADQWLDRQGCPDFEPVESVYQAEILPSGVPQSSQASEVEDTAPQPELDTHEEALMAKLDDALLKSIFNGLLQKQN
jgi:hypothetical protein